METVHNMTLTEKPARRISEIPPAVLKQLNTGKRSTGNLVEWLAVDQGQLAEIVFREISFSDAIKPARLAISLLKTPTAMKQTLAIGQSLAAGHPKANGPVFKALATHPSDIVRNWAAGWIGFSNALPLQQKLKQLRPFAADAHFGVREMAWMAVREDIINQLEDALHLLEPWSHHKDPGLRRFASEATRPCGVWCRHLTRLKYEPQLALPLLEPLHADDSKYVRDSVANWLNDAGKTQPEWVKQLCSHWQETTTQPQNTSLIIKRALRNLE